MPTVKMEITGMSCQHCVSRIRETLDSFSGVREAEVVIGRASIEFDERACTVAELVAAVHDSGGFHVPSFTIEKSDA